MMNIISAAISHFEYGISHDIFEEPVKSYAKAAVDALRAQQKNEVTVTLPIGDMDLRSIVLRKLRGVEYQYTQMHSLMTENVADTICRGIEACLVQQQPNASLTLDELREMEGEPVWCAELQCYGIIKVETIGRWANIPFLIGAWRAPNCGSAVNFEYDIASRELTLYRYKPKEGTT